LHKVLIIGGRDLCSGFALAGVETCVAEDADSAAGALAKAAESGEYGVVVLDEQLAAGFDERTRQSMSGSDVPVVIAVPGQMRWQDVEAMEPDDYVARLIRQAVGYQLDIKL